MKPQPRGIENCATTEDAFFWEARAFKCLMGEDIYRIGNEHYNRSRGDVGKWRNNFVHYFFVGGDEIKACLARFLARAGSNKNNVRILGGVWVICSDQFGISGERTR